MLQKLSFDIEARDQTSRAFRSVNQSLGRTERTLNQVEGRAHRAGRALATGIAGLASIAAVDRLGRAFAGAIDDLDNIAKSADKIGITTDALQELRFAADLSGVSVEKLDTGLNRFARVASDANEGLSTAVRGFERLGVQVTDTDGRLKPIDELLTEVAAGFAEMEDATQRAATAQELFGRSGTELVNLLAAGADGLERMRGEARELGIVISEDLVRDAVVMKDELTKAFTALEARWNSFLITFLRGADRLFDFIPDDTETALAKRVEELREIQDTLAARSQGFGFEDFFAGPTSNLEARQEELLEEIRLLEERRQLQAKLDAAANDLGSGGGGGGGGSSATANRAAGFERLTESIAEQVAQERLALRVAGLSEEAAAELTAKYELQRLEIQLLEAAKASKGAVDAEELAQARAQIAELGELQAARRAEAAALEAEAEAARTAEQAQRALAGEITTLGDELERVIDQGGNWLDILRAIAEQILNMPALQQAIGLGGGAGPGGGGLLENLGGALGGLIFGGGGSGVTTAANNPFSAGLFTAAGQVALPHFHEGADFRVGGETGVDRNLVQFMATRGERVQVTPADQAGAPTFGSVVFNFPGVRDRESAREAAGSAKRRLAELTRKGGGYL